MGRDKTVATARCTQHLLFADQQARGSPDRPACAAAGRTPSTTSTPTENRSACRRCRSSGTGGNIGEGLKVELAGRRHRGRSRRDRQRRHGLKRRSEARMASRIEEIYLADRVSRARSACATGSAREENSVHRRGQSSAGCAMNMPPACAAFRGRLVPAGKDLSANSPMSATSVAHRSPDCPARTASRSRSTERGVNEALESGVGEIASVISATEEHSQANRATRSRESAIDNVNAPAMRA